MSQIYNTLHIYVYLNRIHDNYEKRVVVVKVQYIINT